MAGTFPISGQIDPKSFPFLVADLHRNGATGSLKVEGPTYQKALYYRAGRILFGSSNDPRDQLGAILIEEGRITPEQLEDVNSKVGPGNPLAKVLSETGFVSQRELSDAARAKVERILCDLIGYTSGSFEFEDGVLPKGAVDLKLSTERLMLTAVRRITDRTFVLRHLEGLDVILRATPDLAALRPELEPETGGLLAQLDGVATLKEAASRTRLDDFEAAKVACGLLFVGVVERAGAGGSLLDLGDTAREALNPTAWAQPIDTEPEPAPRSSVGDDSIIAWANSDPLAFALAAETARNAAAAAEAAKTAAKAAKAPAAAPAPPMPDPNPAFFIPEEEPLKLGPVLTPSPPPPPRPAAAIPSEPVVPPIRKAATPAARPASPPPPPPAPEPPTIALSELPPPPAAAPPPAPEPPRAVPPSRTWTPPAKAKAPEPPPVLSDAQGPGSVTQARPSKEDLAALDALLGPRTLEGPLEPLERAPEARWQPPARSVQAKRSVGGGSKIALIALGLVAVVGAGAAGWYYFLGPGAGPRTAGNPPPSARPTLAPTASPALRVSPPPSLAPSARPTAAPTIAPTPAPTPAATPVAVTGGDPLARARAQLRGGDLDSAARGFEAHLRSGAAASTYSIQLFVACAPDTVQKAVGEVGAPELFILPVSYKGKACFRLCWGVYGNAAGATAASRALPDYFVRGGAAPRVMSAAELLK
jgi:hypothetical protein